MDRTDSRVYSVNDFREWSNTNVLELAPRFQRRPVWSPKARSYLIDSIIRGLPMPKIFMRQHIDDAGRTIREIVDGQQRIRTVLSYLNEGFPVMPVHGGKDYGGKYFEDLPKPIRDKCLNYSISVDVLIGATDTEVLDIFARLNTYGVRLNKQELINAKYFGHFKQVVYSLGYEYYRFWIDNGILTEKKIARMFEAELTGELLIAMIAGIQSRNVEEKYYKKYDDDLPKEEAKIGNFKACMDLIGEIVGSELKEMYFSSVHMFYSLFCAIYDLNLGLDGSQTPIIEFNRTNRERVRLALADVDELLNEDHENLKEKELRFVLASTRRTTDLTARKTRHEYLVNRILENVREGSK